MSEQASELLPDDATLETAVAEYLKRHPDFFEGHLSLLAGLHVPHPSGGAVSLVERQVRTLREQLDNYKKQLSELVQVARQNDTLNSRLHRLTLELIGAGGLEEVLMILQDGLHEQFDADAVELRLLSADEMSAATEQGRIAGGEAAAVSHFRRFFDAQRPLCGRLKRGQLDYLFGSQADEILSTALIPLRGDGLLGMLAIGSRDQERFRPGMGTEFLVRLGEVVSRTLERHSIPGA